MKNVKLLLSLLLAIVIENNIHAQAGIVYDPTNNAELVKSSILQGETVSNTAAMVTSLGTAIDYLKTTEEALKKVSAGLETIIWSKRVYQRQIDIIKMQYELSVKAQKLKNLSAEELLRFNNQLLTVVRGAEAVLGSAKDILTSGIFKMSDSDRMKELKDLDRFLSFQQTVMKIQYFEVKTISEEREIMRTYRMVN